MGEHRAGDGGEGRVGGGDEGAVGVVAGDRGEAVGPTKLRGVASKLPPASVTAIGGASWRASTEVAGRLVVTTATRRPRATIAAASGGRQRAAVEKDGLVGSQRLDGALGEPAQSGVGGSVAGSRRASPAAGERKERRTIPPCVRTAMRRCSSSAKSRPVY